MKQIVTSLVFATALSHAASLQVYQDSTIYTYTPDSHYLGMVHSVSATCKGQPFPLALKVSCENSDRLCREFTALQSAEEQFEALKSNIVLLDQIITLHQPEVLDAKSTIEAAREISQERSKLESQRKKDKASLELQKKAYFKQTRAKQPLYYQKRCDAPVDLKFPRGSVAFRSFYEAEFSKANEVKVSQFLSLTNRTGLDIVAEDATFYHRLSQRTVSPVYFNPWIVSEYQPPEIKHYSKSMPKRASMAAPAMEMMAEDMAVVVPVAEYIDAREYKIKDLVLPSTGEAVEVMITTWNSTMECGLHVSPYVHTTVYERCSFTPQTQIENHTWKIKEGDEVINNRAIGEYRDKKYNLYTKIDEDIKVTRKPIVLKEKDTGFFGGTIRKKDGYTVTLTNKSDKSKTVTVTERIPTSTTEEIKVKLLSVKSEKRVDFKQLKDGKVEMKIVLAPGQEQKVEVLFELSYDKDMKVRY